jgi:nicotinate-nucleotide pyrophosphorylase (carboxylating)
MPDLIPPPADVIAETVRQALAEDVGAGDVSATLIPEHQQARASIVCRSATILCGSVWAGEAFRQVDERIGVNWLARDSDTLAPGTVICRLAGPARGILTAERTALNFLQTLSGTATLARRYADAIKGTGTVLLDTRKTLPGMRLAQKYAVRCGGCRNHRTGLFDAFLIKENHIRAAGGIAEAIARARNARPELPVEVEVQTLDELRSALAAAPDRILLDNFDLSTLRRAVTLTARQVPLEASGGITLDTLRAVAGTGVDFISLGVLTKDIQAADLSLLFD